MATIPHAAQHSLDSESAPQHMSKNVSAPATRRTPRPWGLTSARLWIHVVIIVLAIPCIIMSLVPLADMQDEYIGETYWRYIGWTASMSLAPFFCLCLSIAEIATYLIRPVKRGIHPYWFLGLSIFCMLCAWIAAIMNAVIVGVQFDDKNNDFINHLGDACQDREKFWDGSVTCYDGWYEREGLFVALTVLGFVLAVAESVLCCFLSSSDVRVRKQQRHAQHDA